MPTHWESSERPLFVKTVIVNGSRHAILSEVDPLCQARRQEGSCNGCAPAPHCLDLPRDEPSFRRARSCYPTKRDVSTELQNCLIKLRVALGTQENKKKVKREVAHLSEDGKRKNGKHIENWKHLKKSLKRIKKSGKCSTFSDTSSNAKEVDFTAVDKVAGHATVREKDHEEYREIITNMTGSNEMISESETENPAYVDAKKERTNRVQKILPLTDAAEEFFRNYSNYFFPIMYIKANVIPWDDEQSKNLLSERVLQWLDLAQKRKINTETEKSEITTNSETISESNSERIKKLADKPQERNDKALQGSDENSTEKPVKERPLQKQIFIRKPDEDVEEEVKQESDIETALSSSTAHEYPKFSRELNKQHIMKLSEEEPVEEKADEPYQNECCWENSLLSIPERTSTEYSITEQLQQSILSSFEAIVSLERRTEPQKTYKVPRKKSVSTPTNAERKKGLLMKQASIRMSSDEDETEPKETRRKCRKSFREPSKKQWEHKRRCKHLGQRPVKSSNDENEEPKEESIHILYNERPLNKDGRSWFGDPAVNKPQLHIFMPGLDSKLAESQEESASDTETHTN